MLQIIVDVSKGDLEGLCLLPFCLGRRAFWDAVCYSRTFPTSELGIQIIGSRQGPIGNNTILADMWIEVFENVLS